MDGRRRSGDAKRPRICVDDMAATADFVEMLQRETLARIVVDVLLKCAVPDVGRLLRPQPTCTADDVDDVDATLVATDCEGYQAEDIVIENDIFFIPRELATCVEDICCDECSTSGSRVANSYR